MSTDPTGAESKFKPKRLLHLEVSKKDWCMKYRPGTLYCRVEQNFDRSLCLYCKHRRPLDIPGMLNDWEKENR